MAADDELEAIRQRKLQALQEQMVQQAALEQQAAEEAEAIEAQVQSILRQAMDTEARERLARIKMVRPDIASALERQIVTLVSQGSLRRKVTDVELRGLLEKMTAQQREISIRRV